MSAMLVDPGQPGADAESSPRSAVIGVIAGDGVQIGVLLDSEAPLSVMIDPLLKVINSRLLELGVAPLKSETRGRWVLSLVDGTALRLTQSLTEQDICDGDRLWLRFIEDPEHRTQVIEHISTAVAVNLSKRYAAIDPVTAVQVGAAMMATGVLLAAALLGWWRHGHDTWLSAVIAAVAAVLVLAAATVILVQAKTVPDRRVGDVLLLSGLPLLAVAAAAAVPGDLGAPHAALGFGVAGIAAVLMLRFTGRRLATYTAIVTVTLAVLVAGAARMVLTTSPVTLLTCVLLTCVLGYHLAPALSRWFAGIRLPVFPSATSRWVFETRPDLPTTTVTAPGESPTLEGPESVRDVLLHAERARSLLSGLLAGFGVLVVVSATWLCDPHSGRRWLPVVVAGLVAGFLLLRGRSFMDRWQAITLATTGVCIIAAVIIRFALVLSSPVVVAVGASILVVLPAAGLLAAAVIPNTIYSPMFRKFVEWIEYLCLMPIFPLALWMMNAYEAIRYR